VQPLTLILVNTGSLFSLKYGIPVHPVALIDVTLLMFCPPKYSFIFPEIVPSAVQL